MLYSRPNTFKNNQLINNTIDANFGDRFFDEFDRSNIVDGTPICYWLWQKNMAVPTDSGYVVLLSCQNITVQNLVISGRRQAMLLSEVTNSTITKNTVTNNDGGILMAGSSNNQITKNLLANNTYGLQMINSVSINISGNRIPFNVNFGIQMDDCSNNTIMGNYISHGKQALILNRGTSNAITGNSIFYTKEKSAHFGESTTNLVTGNTIAWSNGFALTTSGTVGNNSFYHNNFVNNAGNDLNQARPGTETPNSWDNGKEGNFFSDYQSKYPTGKQVLGAGVWDTAVVWGGQNVDHFPLVKPVTMTYEVTLLQPTGVGSNVSGDAPLVFFATGPVSWMGYSIDGAANITVNSEVGVVKLPVGAHSITVYAGSQEGVCGSDTIQLGQPQTSTNNISPTPTLSVLPTLTNPPTVSPSFSMTPTATAKAQLLPRQQVRRKLRHQLLPHKSFPQALDRRLCS
jgi:parallel beta-helix repeat protein